MNRKLIRRLIEALPLVADNLDQLGLMRIPREAPAGVYGYREAINYRSSKGECIRMSMEVIGLLMQGYTIHVGTGTFSPARSGLVPPDGKFVPYPDEMVFVEQEFQMIDRDVYKVTLVGFWNVAYFHYYRKHKDNPTKRMQAARAQLRLLLRRDIEDNGWQEGDPLTCAQADIRDQIQAAKDAEYADMRAFGYQM